jgi:hypothetical protein
MDLKIGALGHLSTVCGIRPDLGDLESRVVIELGEWVLFEASVK